MPVARDFDFWMYEELIYVILLDGGNLCVKSSDDKPDGSRIAVRLRSDTISENGSEADSDVCIFITCHNTVCGNGIFYSLFDYLGGSGILVYHKFLMVSRINAAMQQ